MIRSIRMSQSRCVLLGILVWTGCVASHGAIYIGSASTTITPDGPVALAGQMRLRIAKEVESPCMATALVIEKRDAGNRGDHAVFVSCDLVAIRPGILEDVRAIVGSELEDIDPQKIVLSATHTHTAPVMNDGTYVIPEGAAIAVQEYRTFLVQQLAAVISEAWNGRTPGKIGWGLGHAVVGQNRRAVYANGEAKMYGATNDANFRAIEGYEDHGVEVLFCWNADEQLVATAINVACPSQEVEGRSAVNADFWHQIREQLQANHGPDLNVLGWTGAAGDQSPHLMLREAAEERMRRLRKLDRLEEITRRVIHAWNEAYEGARQEMLSDVVVTHRVSNIQLPMRDVTEEEYADAKKQVAQYQNDPQNSWRLKWNQRVVDRFEQRPDRAEYSMELHAVRIGDVAVVTNDFELFTDFGIQMKARSPALQTFVVQLAGPGSYLPTAEAVRGGGYSAVVQSSEVGPEGGQVLVESTLSEINELWSDSK